MADTALHSMTANTAPDPADEIYLLDDPGGTPADNRITHSNLLKVNGLTEDTAPDRTADYMLTYDNSATASKKVLVGKIAPYVFVSGTASSSNDPADATTYYWGDMLGNATWSTTATLYRMYLPLSGTITKAYIHFNTFGTLGTSETSSLYIRVNNSTDTLLTSAIDLSAAHYYEAVTGLSVSISAGNYINCKWTTPTWTTNPTDVYPVVKFVVE